MRQRFLVEVTLTVVGKGRKLGCTVARVIEDAVVAEEEEDNGRLERLLHERWQEDNAVRKRGKHRQRKRCSGSRRRKSWKVILT